ncbi:MAG TPA: FAD/NAD(P)-binding oxidoreductase [Burkholderiaceae bacterium]|nr:FAD/NAD(P)-binding oxidoreductase [Burkholderiaceae bacterium]HMY99544.1 FAD/NAD(P)-binding oxidoreductase [Burkholderiaceae bacterium]HNB44124.1 FAD/NAD(P)-binding oxidoreductase [Burkholderiaceae bacterium]
MDRRGFLGAGAALASGWLAGCGGGGDDGLSAEQAASLADASDARMQALAVATTTPKARVIVVGGGMAGATFAKYMRLWGNAVEVTLVDRSSTYTSNIMSSMVLTGQRTLSSLNYGYSTLVSKYGIKTVFGEVKSIDPVLAKVTMASGTVLTADRIVLAPGVDFDAVPGLTDPLVMPHAWKAGAQTTALASQLNAMKAGGTVVLTIPKAPYRCPPGPYERACLLADWLKVKKKGSKLIVLDANADILVEKDNFTSAFLGLHGSVIEYRNNVAIDHVDPATRTLYFTGGGSLKADVVNLIPRQRAGALVAATGLANATEGRFAAVNVLDYSSTAAPSKVHVLGDASATTQPKAGHIANQEAKVCADALTRIFAGGSPDPAPVTNSACFSTITMSKASWLHSFFQYDPVSRTMVGVAAGSGASLGWDADGFEDMGTWFKALMADSFA